MKILFEDGDMAFYEGKRCTVIGASVMLNELAGVHIKTMDGDTVLVPVASLQTFDSWLLDQCIDVLQQHEKWEANLIMDEGDSLLESMSDNNYNEMLTLQTLRQNFAVALSHRNRGKS